MYRTTQQTQRRKDARKRSLLDAAARAFSQKGYHDTTVKDIVDGAAVSVGTFYFYFKSKEDLFRELYGSIVAQFGDVTMGVVDTERFSLLKNFTRVMTATLWMYQQKRGIARILLRQTAVPGFQALEAARMETFVAAMVGWFERFRSHGGVNIPDPRVAALIYAGSYRCLVDEWLEKEPAVPLTEYGFPFCVYHLQALGIPFDEGTVREYSAQVLDELNGTEQKSTNEVEI